MIIKLVRHGQSMANTGEVQVADVGDHTVALTALGHQQAADAGRRIGGAFMEGALAYCSPFRRARQTMAGVLAGAGVDAAAVRVFEDPRLREVDHGYVDPEPQKALRRTHGWFYYRYNGGESPADCYDRTSAFLESLMRQAKRKGAERVLVVTHSLTIRCFVMRFLHLKVEDFDRMAGLDNGAVVTLAPREELESPVFTSGRWGVVDLPLRPDAEGASEAWAPPGPGHVNEPGPQSGPPSPARAPVAAADHDADSSPLPRPGTAADRGSEEYRALVNTVERQYRWYDRGSRMWSSVHHGSLFLSAILSAAAALVLKLESAVPQASRNDTAAMLATGAALAATLAAAGGFSRKWRSNRISRGRLEQVRIDLTDPQCDLSAVRGTLKEIVAEHDRQIVGGGE